MNKIPDFIPTNLRPPNSPDLNPVNYRAGCGGILLELMYQTHVLNLNELKQRLLIESAVLDHAIIAAAVQQWHHPLTLRTFMVTM